MYIKNMVQKKLNAMDCGLNISFVELKEVSPPSRVQRYFDNVINSKMDKRKMISNAESYFNEKIPLANATANQMVEQALSYQEEVVAKARARADEARV